MLASHGRHVAHRRTATTRRVWRPNFLALSTALCALLGLIFITYPTAAAWLSQYNQSLIVSDYSERIKQTEPSGAEHLLAARNYNEALTAGAILEANTNVPTGNGKSSDPLYDYNTLLAVDGTSLMARIRIPSIELDLPVYHGTSEATLLSGIGHLRGTSLPVGGAGTRTVLTGHRGLANAEMFTNLDQVENGDTFSIDVFGETITYRVFDTKVVEPHETEAIRAEEGRDLATLVTCTPLGVNSHRILLTGERVFPTPDNEIIAAQKDPSIPRFPWWIVWSLAGVLLLASYVWRSGLRPLAAPTPPATSQSDEVASMAQ